jgi:hypothetical protein
MVFRQNTRCGVRPAWAKSQFSGVLIIFAAGAPDVPASEGHCPAAERARKLRHIWGEVDRKVLNRPKQRW